MLRLRDIMTTDIVTLDPNLTIREAMDTFASRRISGAPVIEGAVVVGVVSATDLLQLAASLPGVPTERDPGTDILEDASGNDIDTDRLSSENRDDPSALFFTDLWDDAGATVVEINPERTPLTPRVDHFLQGPSGEILPALMRAVWPGEP